ncbi:MAPEG family protein [uncultured Paraglaciecola sp.]|uniref:MAPEG family protein n=1 Tax=uncultured Paraglaciecola sp. TaxID=1765024 RepID=UPI00259624F7|nr:MAPEG family protein [uncultured Paraglaciecola sp.]
MAEQYHNVLFVLLSLLAMMVLQQIVATVAHRKQKDMVPGVVDSQLDHYSFVFRSHRTFMNSLENVPIFVLTALVGLLVGIESQSLFIVSSVFLVARFIHMVLFYLIATNTNPSPRSYFYMIGLLSQIYLIGLVGWSF